MLNARLIQGWLPVHRGGWTGGGGSSGDSGSNGRRRGEWEELMGTDCRSGYSLESC